MEKILLSTLLHDRSAWESVRGYLDGEEVTATGALVLKAIEDYYLADETAERVIVDILGESLVREHPKQSELIRSTLRECSSDLVSTNVVREVLEIKRKAKGEDLAMAIAAGDGPAAVKKVLTEYADLNDATDLASIGGTVQLLDTPLAEIVKQAADPGNVIRLLPKRLNDALRGGVLLGHTVVIIGRVNVGKSALAITNIAGFLQQGLRVMMVENEDLPEDVARRIGCRLVRCSLDWAEANPEKFEERALKKGYGNLMIPDPVPGTVEQVERAAAQLNADVVVVNQLRHLASTKAAEADNTTAVDRVAQQLRSLGKRHRRLMVLVGAALEGETEKAVLERHDSYGSKTGVPGIADVMLAIGTDENLRERNAVAIHLCKNKRSSREPVLYQRVNLENCIFEDM